MMHALYEIWEEHIAGAGPISVKLPWHVKMSTWIAHFPTKDAAEAYVAGIKEYREKKGLK